MIRGQFYRLLFGIDDLIFGTFNRFYLVNISVCPYKT